MKKPDKDDFVGFDREFKKASARAGKKQYLVPYFIASHPGSDLDSMIELALFLKRNHYQPDQVQDFIPSPFDIAACMYHTGLDPFTKKPVYIAKHLRDRKLQRALLQFFKPENYFEVRRALEQAGRQDLIGGGCDCLIPERPPKEALDARRGNANRGARQPQRARGCQRALGRLPTASQNGHAPPAEIEPRRAASASLPVLRFRKTPRSGNALESCSLPINTPCSISVRDASWSNSGGTCSIGPRRPPKVSGRLGPSNGVPLRPVTSAPAATKVAGMLRRSLRIRGRLGTKSLVFELKWTDFGQWDCFRNRRRIGTGWQTRFVRPPNRHAC